MGHSDRPVVLITCEHATCFVPKPFKNLFAGHDEMLRSHRGWDPGTLDLGELLSKRFGFPLFKTKVSRLLVEVNRSIGHKRLFSDFSQSLDKKTKQALLSEYYFSHRNAVEGWIASQTAAGCNVLHLSLHSFTPCLDGIERTADIGLLYDPRREGERKVCDRWKEQFRQVVPQWRIRRNYPYLGRSDGFTTYLRKRFADDQYCGIELEVNQQLVNESDQWRGTYRYKIADTVEMLTQQFWMQ